MPGVYRPDGLTPGLRVGQGSGLLRAVPVSRRGATASVVHGVGEFHGVDVHCERYDSGSPL
jgi:hypothetical protein